MIRNTLHSDLLGRFSNGLLKFVVLVVMACNMSGAFAATETIEGNHILTSNKSVANNDTLVIKGNLTITDNKTLTLKNSAVLRVTGNLTINSKGTLELNNGSKLLVNGNVTQKESLGLFVVNTGEIDANKAMIVIEGNYIVETMLGWNGSSAIDDDKNKVYVFGESTFNQDKYGNEVSFLNDTGFSSIDSFLPIELTSFTATATDYGFEFNWVTASENENDYFTLEYSIDGVHFKELLREDGNGTTSVTNDYYATASAEEFAGITYFRLKQTDFNGEYSYSDVIFVSIVSEETELYVFPNPTTDYVSVSGNVASAYVSDMYGRNMSCLQTSENTFNVAGLSVGTYYVVVSTKNGKKVLPFVKK